MSINDVTYLVGQEYSEADNRPVGVFDREVCAYLDALSKALLGDAETKTYPDIVSFGFWCRKANIQKISSRYADCQNRLGRGMSFHIAPSNVPINFAFSLAFGLLAGNPCIVRVSEKDFPQVNLVCRCMNELLKKDEFADIRRLIRVVKYSHDKEITDYFSSKCMTRIIWGGDQTVQTIKESKAKARCLDVAFADRYSFAIFDDRYIGGLDDKALNDLANKFYNDTYLMDQNACSSPHLILWTNSEGQESHDKFWLALSHAASKYDLQDKKVMDKYTMACELATSLDENVKIETYGNLLYVARIKALPDDLEDSLRGRFGLFFEKECNDIENDLKHFTERTQTCIVAGVDRNEIAGMVIDNGIAGIDRIVEVGQAMDIGINWDGFDLINVLSRELIL